MKLTEIINKHDPISLLKIGAPKDEYKHEINAIAKGLKSCKSKKEIQQLVYDTFVKFFSKEIAGNFNQYDKIAEEIYSKLF